MIVDGIGEFHQDNLVDGWVCYGCGEDFDGMAPWGMYCPAPSCREAYRDEFGEPYNRAMRMDIGVEVELPED